MGQIEILAGQIPGGGGTQRLPDMLEGAPIDAEAPLNLGLVHRLVPEHDLVKETQISAARLAQRQPTAVAALKRSVYFGTRGRPFGRGLDMELSGFVAGQLTRASAESLRTLNADIARLGDSPFLADPEPWVEGTRLQQVP